VSTPDIRKALEAITNAMDVMGDKPDRPICPDVWRSLKCEALIADARAALAAPGQAPQPVAWVDPSVFAFHVAGVAYEFTARTHRLQEYSMPLYAGASPQAAAPTHIRIMAQSVLNSLSEAFPREEVDLDAVRALANFVARPQAQPTPTDTPT
jgi:hypothetical protein